MMKRILGYVAFVMMAVMALPGFSGAVAITVYDQSREVSAVSRIYENWYLFDSSQDSWGNASLGAWNPTALAYVQYEYCALGPCITGAYAQAEATQVSDIDLATDGSSLAIDIFQSADSDVYNVVSPVAGTYTDYYNFFGVIFELDVPTSYSLNLNSDFTGA